MKIHRLAWLILLLIPYFLGAQSNPWGAVPFTLNSTPRFFYDDPQSDWLYIGGNFWEVDGDSCNYLIRYQAGGYEKLAMDRLYAGFIPEPPLFMTRYEGNLLLGGFRGLISWDEQNWDWIDSSQMIVADYYQKGNQIIFMGRFPSIGGSGYGSIAAWDGQNWESVFGLDSLLDFERGDYVDRIVSFQGDLIFSGDWRENAMLPDRDLVKWTGSGWAALGDGLNSGVDNWMEDMLVYKDELYVAGRFFKAAGAQGNHIARWNGQRWDDLGGGANGSEIEDLFVFKDQLWVVGRFTQIGGIPAQYIAKWDGERWCSLGSEFDNGLTTMGSYQDTLYLGGGFWSIDGDSSMNKVVKLLDPSYADTCSAPIVASVAPPTPEAQLRAYPNPAQQQVTLQATFARAQLITLRVHNALGQLILTQRQQVPAGTWQKTLEVADWPVGVYLVNLLGDDAPQTLKVVKQ